MMSRIVTVNPDRPGGFEPLLAGVLSVPGVGRDVYKRQDQERNEVQIAVRPNTQEPFARLSEHYLRRIQDLSLIHI